MSEKKQTPAFTLQLNEELSREFFGWAKELMKPSENQATSNTLPPSSSDEKDVARLVRTELTRILPAINGGQLLLPESNNQVAPKPATFDRPITVPHQTQQPTAQSVYAVPDIVQQESVTPERITVPKASRPAAVTGNRSAIVKANSFSEIIGTSPYEQHITTPRKGIVEIITIPFDIGKKIFVWTWKTKKRRRAMYALTAGAALFVAIDLIAVSDKVGDSTETPTTVENVVDDEGSTSIEENPNPGSAAEAGRNIGGGPSWMPTPTLTDEKSN